MPNKQNQIHDSGICGAKTRAGTPCQQRAGWGTDHVGEGRCKLHGGKCTGPKNQKQNKNAKKHGLYLKYFPKETLELFGVLDEEDPAEILWNNIKIQYSSIIQAQNTAELLEDEFEKAQAKLNIMNAQSRAMVTLNSMIKQYDEMCNSGLATEEQKLRIEKIKSDLERNKADTERIKQLVNSGGEISIKEVINNALKVFNDKMLNGQMNTKDLADLAKIANLASQIGINDNSELKDLPVLDVDEADEDKLEELFQLLFKSTNDANDAENDNV